MSLFIFLVSVTQAFIFEDLDCLFAPKSWTGLRRTLIFDPNSITNEELAVYLDGVSVCPLGVRTACLLLHLRGENCDPFDVSMQPFPTVLQLVTSEWPLLNFLQVLNRMEIARAGFVDACDSLFHPSEDWRKYRSELDRGLALWGDAMNFALTRAFAVAWKAGSEALYPESGLTVSHYTKQCPLGVVATNLMRTLGFVLSPPNAGDTMRIVELYFTDTNRIFRSQQAIRETLVSSWPIFRVLIVIQNVAKDKMRRASLTVHPNSFNLPYSGDEEPILVLHVSQKHAYLLKLAVQRYTEFKQKIFVITESRDILDSCSGLTGQYIQCLPVISENPVITKYSYLYRFLEISSTVVCLTPDFVPLDKSFLAEAVKLVDDIGLLPELYSRFYSERIFVLKRTHLTYTFLDVLLEYALHAPFADERAALHFILDSDSGLGLVPAVSFLSRTVPNVRVARLSGLFAASEGFVPRASPTVLGIEYPCPPENLECLEDAEALYRGEENATRRILQRKIHGDFAGSRKRFEASAEQISRHPQMFNRTDVLKNKRRVCPDPVAPPVDTSDVENAFMYHVNFAHNCCERDQKLSSLSGLQFFANESRPLNGTIMDAEFMEKNEEILNFDRTNLVVSKTPSNLRGYYVWKPYAILKGVCDLPYGSIVVYTDAGVVIKRPLRQLLKKYLDVSDLTAVQSEMYEQARSKRDAFLVIDADFTSIAASQQIASAIIAFRKTPNTMDFLEWWLAALESKYVITEEPSVMGREYEGFVNSNDDQTGFSLLFKKFGFIPFSYLERNEVIDMARNIAKFLNAADAYALGLNHTAEGYLSAADSLAEQKLAEQKLAIQ